ncbi:unnamed protein product [Prunus armeniaca]
MGHTKWLPINHPYWRQRAAFNGKPEYDTPPEPLIREEVLHMNRTHPEGCIAEPYIAKETVKFCTEHLSDVSTVGVTSSQMMGGSKPLLGCTVSLVDQDLLN